MSKTTFRWSLAILVTTMLALLSVIGSQTTPKAATQGMAEYNRHIVADQLMERLAGLYNRTMRVCSLDQARSLCENAHKTYTMALPKIAEARRTRNNDQVLILYSKAMDEIEVALREVEALRK